VTGIEDEPEAVLIRSVEPLSGIEIIKDNRNIKSNNLNDLTNGPGKLCQALKIDKKLNGVNLINHKSIYIEKNSRKQEIEIGFGKRINIDYAEEYKDKLWRFYLK
jgi:DNA-3-methyladenine glycosylase